MTTTDVSSLFTPATIGSLRLKNRVVKSPQTTATANQDGTVTQRTVNHYKRLAEGGVGLVLVEYTYVDDDASKSIHAQIGASRREHVAGLGWLADEVHAAGAKIGLQLEHCGRQRFLAVPPIKSASDSSWDYVEGQHGVRPTPMTKDEIAGVIRAFGKAAERAYRARFDLVEVHAGHGYLITNFLSPHTNTRTDEYGGSFENRRRLLLEVVDSIRAHVPADFPISVRVSVTDYEADGIGIEETVELCALLEEHGVDVIHASGGHHARMDYEVSPWFMPRALHRWGWEQISERVSIPVIASGSIVRPELAAEIVASGSADFVSLGRPMLADPDWAKKAQAGRLLEIVPCIRCNDGCLHRGINTGRSVGCTVNPILGHEYSFEVQPSATSRSVAVVGGGPAGLKAAATLADRGHAVTLYSRNEPGGGLARAAAAFDDTELTELHRHLVHEVTRRDITITRTDATADLLSGAGHDAVVIATGCDPMPLAIDVASDANCIVVDDLTRDELASLTGPVVVIGGGVLGVRSATILARRGVDVTVIEQAPRLLADGDVFTDQISLPGLLQEAGAAVLLEHRATAITADGVQVVSAGSESIVPARTVIIAIGHHSDVTDWESLSGVETVEIGGAVRPGRVFDALHDAFFATRTL